MENALVQIAVVFFGVLLTVIVSLMTWMSINIMKAGKNIAVLDHTFKRADVQLEKILVELKEISRHEAHIAVLNNQVSDLRSEMALVFEKIKSLEYPRHENSVHRRQ